MDDITFDEFKEVKEICVAQRVFVFREKGKKKKKTNPSGQII